MAESKYFDKEFSDLAETLLADYHVPSISVAVVDEGKTYSKAYGLARFPSTPATPDSLYFTGSTTKAIVAAAIGVLIKNPEKIRSDWKSDEPLSWETSLRSVLGDDFQVDDPYVTKNATIEDALCHRIGLSGHEIIAGGFAGQRPRGLTKGIRHLGPLNKPFRTAFQYNNFMYAVAGDVLETLTGLTCGEALKQLIWDPLGMEHTFWEAKEVIDASHIDVDKDMSRGYFWFSEKSGAEDKSLSGGHFVPDEYFNFAGIAPAGSIISSVTDYAKWMQALLDASSGAASPSSPITTELFQDLTSPRITTGIPLPNNAQITPCGYGLGWLILPSTVGPLHPIISHSGGLLGYGTLLHLLPNDSFGIVTVGNTMLSSTIVGHILTQELIIRKMGLKEPGRERERSDFNIMMKAENNGLEQCVDIDDERGNVDPSLVKDMYKKGALLAGQEMSVEEFIPKTDEKGSSALKDLAGIYQHGAYGKFRISFVPSTSDTSGGSEKMGKDTFMRPRFQRDKNLNDLKDECRSACHSLRVQGMGNRTWRFEYLLHPRVATTAEVKESQTSDNKSNKADDNENKGVHWFDQEFMCGHGFTNDDVVPGLATGTDEDEDQANGGGGGGGGGSGRGKCKRAIVWESVIWTRLGGAAVVSDQATGKVKLGLTLANTYTGVDGTKGKGWEKRMVWFEKMDDSSSEQE